MNGNATWWLAGGVLAIVTLAQWVLLRWRYLGGLTKQRVRHAHQMQTAGQHIEQAKRQIAQLQLDLGSARTQLTRLNARHAAATSAAARTAAGAPADAATAPRRGEPFDGFADTLPALQFPHDPSLLATYPARR